jgi:hypothetical protein
MPPLPLSLQCIRNLNLQRYANIVYPLVITPKTRYLALCGNIIDPTVYNYRIYKSFLNYCSTHWEKVFYIPGPSENRFGLAIQELCEPHANIKYLDMDIYKFPEKKLHVIGTTLLGNPYSEKWLIDSFNEAYNSQSQALLLTHNFPPLLVDPLIIT